MALSFKVFAFVNVFIIISYEGNQTGLNIVQKQQDIWIYIALFFLYNPLQTLPGEELNKHSWFRSDPIVRFMLVSCSSCDHVQFMRQ